MKIALLLPWLSNKGGGVTAVVAALARSLARIDGVEVYVLGLTEGPESSLDHDWSGAKLHGIHAWETRLIGFSPKFDRYLDLIQPDIVHVHGLWRYQSIAAWQWQARKEGRSVIISPHGSLSSWALGNSRWKKEIAGALFQRAALRSATCVHALTTAERDEILNYIRNVPIALIPNGVDLPPEEENSVDDDEVCRMLYLGRLHPKKNVSGLIDAWARAGKAREGWELCIAGWDQGGYRSELEAQVNELQLTNSIRFLGALFSREKDAAFRSTTAFVLPSFSEGLPMSVLEAWSYGKPVLMTDGCNLDIGFKRGAAARMDTLPADAANDLVAFLSKSPNELSEMGARGRELVAERFTWKEVATRFIEIYRWSSGCGRAPDYLDEI